MASGGALVIEKRADELGKRVHIFLRSAKMANPALKMVICATAFSIMLLTAHGQEQESIPLQLHELPEGDADGFVTIIGGGDDLRVWKGLEGYWYSRDGILGGHQTKEGSRQTFLVLPFLLRDFELHLKYKFVSPGGNSGIQFRSKILDQKTFRVGGYQADIDASGAYDGSIYDEAGVAGGRGTLSKRGDKTIWNAENQRHQVKIADSQELQKAINIGGWNDVELVAKANHITYSINGHVMTELIDESPNATREGVLALQLHEGFAMDVQFKDGKIRKLD
jgi:hypothetical protein